MEELAFLLRMRDWARQWGEREYYYIKHEDLLFALTNGLCKAIILNQKVLEGPEKQYLFYRNVVLIGGKYFINVDRRVAGH